MSESGKNAYKELAQTIKDKEKIRNISQPVRDLFGFENRFQSIFGSEEGRLKRNAENKSKGNTQDVGIHISTDNIPPG